MRRFGVFAVAILAAALFVFSASAERGSWNNWHVHDGTVVPYTDPTGLTHRGLAFFPLIFAGYASTPSLWAYCADATDKTLVGGDGGAMLVSGQCQNEANIIHLKGVETGAPVPTGWLFVTTGGGGAFSIYYKLTPR